MYGAGSAAQLLSDPTPVIAPPRMPGRAVARSEPQESVFAPPASGFGPAVVVNLRGGATANAAESQSTKSKASESKASGNSELSEEEEKAVQKLKARDQEVRTHEHAHAGAGGQYAGSPSYTYQTGPDGKRYAIGGEVQIDTSPEKDPEATIRKMEIIKRAALSPAEPSAADVKVAASADKIRQDAERELSQQKAEEAEGKDGEGGQGAAASGKAADAAPARDAARFAAAAAAYGGAGRLQMSPIGAGQGSGGIGRF